MKHYKIIGLSLSIVFFTIVLITCTPAHKQDSLKQISYRTATNTTVCPPFHLYDEDGNLIDPVNGINAGKPYSPKQTCGKCHDYDLITEGYHFQQGRDEQAAGVYAERYQWVSHPGNYGGNWCSPAPLYRYLSPKENSSARTMDMTSFSFFTAACGGCHPGGGPGEYDRAGFRYDHFMAHMGYEAGDLNDFDGDYFRARWNQTGVLEADCMICHQPGYDNEERKQQLAGLNFRWAPTAASGWGEVTGSVKSETTVQVSYDLSKFDKDGKLSPHIVREPRNSACLFCHAQPGWKKRGANYDARTDVHLRAGMKCVDCHPAGSLALDDRINQREMHQFGKGDDPCGRVRDDLNNTVISCKTCHTAGYFGAPFAEHRGLPGLHLDRIACQTCHIPERLVKPSHVQASDVFNPGTKITTSGKKLWVFYGPDMKYYNHYGNLEMMGYDDKPTDPFRPFLIRYKGKIMPANRVHSAWPGIEVEGKPGLMQPKMSDIYNMWMEHFQDPAKYPELALIEDDNGDGILEVNRPEEIDALIAAVTSMLYNTDYPMEGKRVVWAYNDRVYTSGNEFYTIEKESWEASPYANVHTFNHDVYPARAALGTKSCTECHSLNSPFYYAEVVQYPFGEDGLPVTVPQYTILGISKTAATFGAFRESVLKPLSPWIILLSVSFIFFHFVICGRKQSVAKTENVSTVLVCRFRLLERIPHYFLMLSFIILGITGFLFFLNKTNPSTQWARDLHGWTGWVFIFSLVFILIIWFRHMIFKREDRVWLRVLGGYFYRTAYLSSGRFNAGQKLFFWLIVLLGAVLAVTGMLMFFMKGNPELSLSVVYTLHDLTALIVFVFVIAHVYMGLVLNPGSINSIFGGYVSEDWLAQNHPDDLTRD
jgi:formate dehydrogenase gamma subunit